ncbi:unnamed protein product [Brassica oleracea]
MTPLSSLLMGKHHTGLHLAPETELALLSDQAVHLVEGLELDKLNEKFLPIKDTHQVGYVQEATTHNVFFWCHKILEKKIFSAIQKGKFTFCFSYRKLHPSEFCSFRFALEDDLTCDGSVNRDYTVLFPLVSQGVLVSSHCLSFLFSFCCSEFKSHLRIIVGAIKFLFNFLVHRNAKVMVIRSIRVKIPPEISAEESRKIITDSVKRLNL